MPACLPHLKTDKAYKAGQGRLSYTYTEKHYQKALLGKARIYYSILGKSRPCVCTYSGNRESTRQATAPHKYQEMHQPNTPRQAVHKARISPRQAVHKARISPRQAVHKARIYRVTQESNTPRQDALPNHRRAPHKGEMQLQLHRQLRASIPAHSRKPEIGKICSYSTESAVFNKDRKARQIPSRASTPRTGKKKEFHIYDKIISYYLCTIRTYYIIGIGYATPGTSIYYAQRYIVQLAPPLQQIILSGIKIYSTIDLHIAGHVGSLGVTFDCTNILDTTNGQRYISRLDQISNIYDSLKDALRYSYYSKAQSYSTDQMLDESKTLQTKNDFDITNEFRQFRYISNIKTMLNYVSHFKDIGINLYNTFVLLDKTKAIFKIYSNLKQLSNRNKLIYGLKNFLIL